MTVSHDKRKAIEAKIQECLDIAKKAYPAYASQFIMPQINYNLRGTTAGKAFTRKWRIDLHPHFIETEWHVYLATTVPHEVAHLIAEAVSTTGRVHHGPGWRRVMHQFGIMDVKRCHQYDVTAVARRRTAYMYKCTKCERTYDLGPKRHARLQYHPRAYWCKCKGNIVYQGTVAPTKVEVVREKQPTKPRTGSKLDACLNLYRNFGGSYSRAEMIHFFVQQADCTPAGAATYYAVCKQRVGY
jgi:SprT protein